METFTFNLGKVWTARLFGGNRLVRPSDRIEALLAVLVVASALLFTPFAGAIGTAVHDSRSGVYAEQSESRQRVTATLDEDAAIVFEHSQLDVSAPVRWRFDGVDHADTVELTSYARAGQHVDIWVDRKGNHVAAPAASWRAGADALLTAIGAWLGAMAVVIGLVALIRAGVNRQRARNWDRELQVLVDDGGRTGRQR